MRILMSAKFARRVALALFLMALVLTLLSFSALLALQPLSQLISARSSLDMPASRELARSVVEIVDVDAEQNIPTWFSASVLLLNSVLLAAIASAKKALDDKYVAHWWALSVIFVMLSMDEVSRIHDMVGWYLSPVVRTSGIFTYFWVIPWSVFVLLVLLTYLRFFFALPRRVGWLFLAAGGLYVGGALGGEMLIGYMVSGSDVVDKRWWQLEVMTEEFLEMMGAIVFFYALTRTLYWQSSQNFSTSTSLGEQGQERRAGTSRRPSL